MKVITLKPSHSSSWERNSPSTSSTNFLPLGGLDVQLFPISRRVSSPLYLRSPLLQYNLRMALFFLQFKGLGSHVPGQYFTNSLVPSSSFLIWYKENVPWGLCTQSRGLCTHQTIVLVMGPVFLTTCQAGGSSTKKCIISNQPKRQSHYQGIHTPA